MRVIRLLFFIFYCGSVMGQSPEVPKTMRFADIKLNINEKARRAIQEDVNRLTQSKKYHEKLAEKARSYFPIVIEIFEREGVPEDFKYLVLQESSLTADAVSSSDAVGYWQMKDFTALELGLIVNKEIDERKSIVSSTMGAARYFKKANEVFDNWLNSLQSYQMGIGGAQRSLGDRDYGKKALNITKDTYWYVRKFLAYKIAFENSVDIPPILSLKTHHVSSGTSLSQISKDFDLDVEQIKRYNKWILRNKIPEEGVNILVLPHQYNREVSLPKEQPKPSITSVSTENTTAKTRLDKSELFPKIKRDYKPSHKYIIGINSIPGIIAGTDDTQQSLALKGNISYRRFLKFNDITYKDNIIPGQVYYLKRKKNKAKTYYHVIKQGENLWNISQKYGIKLKKLKSKNRIVSVTKDDTKPGRVLWLRHFRPKDTPVEYKKVDVNAIPATKIVKTVEEESEDLKNEKNNANNNKSQTSTMAVKNAEVLSDNSEATEEIKDLEDMVIEGKKITHSVKKGETLYSLSKTYDIPVVDIAFWNNISVSQTLYIGDKIILYQKENKSSHKIHIVKSGETLYNISKKYGVPTDKLMELNNKTDTNISIGEKLIISH